MNNKKLPISLKKNDSDKHKGLFDAKGKIQQAVDFLNEHYIIHVSSHNPETVEVEAKNKKLFRYPPTFNDMYLHMRDQCEVNVSSQLLWEIVSSQNYIKPFNPIENYLASIRGKYKGESHIDMLSSCLIAREFEFYEPGECQSRVNHLLRKWMVASIAQWVADIPNPVMLTFIQQQEGTGKTSLCKFLIPEALQNHSSILFQDQIKKMEDNYTRYYFIIHDEMVGVNRWTLERWKQILTSSFLKTKRRTDKYEVNRKRTAVSLATSNKNQERGGFIQSGEEGRRFACIELDSIVYEEYLKLVDINQMWAEALMLYESSEYDYKFDDDFADIIRYNSRYMLKNSSLTYVLLLLSKPESESEGVWMNPTEIIQDISDKKKLQQNSLYQLNPIDIGACLSSLNYRCERRRKCTAPEFADKHHPFPLRRYFVKRNY